jgi:hypothetical protein
MVMKNIYIRAVPFLVVMAFVACNAHRSGKDSVLEFFPRSKSELKANDYKHQSYSDTYYKSKGDTLDRILKFDPETGKFSREFYITSHSKNLDTVAAKSNLIINCIAAKAEKIIFEHYNFKILQIEGDYFFVTQGFSGGLTKIIIRYNNLNLESDRNYSIDYVERLKIEYPDSASNRILSGALTYLKNFSH